MSEKLDNNFLVCQECDGAGYTDGLLCNTCRGLGVVYFLEDKVLYWGQFYDPVNNAYEKGIRKVRLIINAVLALFGISGFIVMAYIGYLDNFSSFFTLKYWSTPSFEKMYFWLTLLVDLYLYYRLDQESSAKYNVLAKHFHKKSEFPNPSLDWQEVWKLKKSKLVDISKSFTVESKKALQASWELAGHFEHHEILRVHLLGVLFQFNKSAIILGRLGVSFDKLKKKISRYLSKHIIARPGNPILSEEMHRLLIVAYLEAYEGHWPKVDLAEIVLALASPEKTEVEKDDVEELLIDFGLNYQQVKNVVAWVRIQDQLRKNWQRYQGKARYKPKSGMDRAMTAIATPMLDRFSEDLTLQAKYGQFFPCIGREKEFEQMFRIIEGSRQGVLLVGNQGVGRTTILQGLAQKMVAEDVPEILQDKRLVSLNISSLLAGADAAAAEQRLMLIINEAMRARNIVLAVENLHNLHGITAGGEQSLDLSEVFAQLLSKHLFHVVATTTGDGYLGAVENKSLDSAFQTVKVEELELNDAIQVLEAKSGPMEYQNHVYFSYSAIEKAAILSSRYIHDRYLPEKAIEILEQSAIKVKKERGENKVVGGEDVAAVISNLTSIPLTQVTQKESEKLLNLEDRIHERMIDQVEAVNIVATSLRRARAELREGKRPIASMLFLGPTGVGKTELAKTVAEVYFSNENAMIRTDMSEYQERSSIDRLIGSGSNTGILTEAVRKNPFALLLFDEVEKAHPDVLNLFLQVLDDGRLTDAQGRTIDFTNTIIIMTSNAGAQYIQDEINKGTSVEEIKEVLINEKLKEHYRPEFLNRFDGVVVFKPLSMMDVIQIAKLMVNKITKRLKEKGIEFTATEAAIAELAEAGFDPKFGARPLRRAIQEKIDDSLAKKILAGEVGRRDKVILEVGNTLRVEKGKEI
ncbi:ATP-dependent Clp protease ATP-binding subunit [Candidatus Falkowbacteria bacterium]|jgi:ATP-dependent Clp protease ATP-binding subunit ClpC|nr:ATP-dependent Clp protease ATP-binding subunit [Candidatus Falkowbacteria bacterium]MBT5503224.1 ATP-dependent Clp protease ATP-binding subunit [Candidatus Falkowbacteria bacterium]MBT6573870.1 ATP-dependent Clp protease ATP-binding subunit [Candidatus Falkowbacteria bacterium]MBT7348523.1 ATP-dependent Clp protease ATP-binding subunit [Candidatus Falkowbacteria bacterium]MBT7500811.1 ATP-dependent Clp protease ATP-binding subunit [Candidatus Falkowbacteria bacterium]